MLKTIKSKSALSTLRIIIALLAIAGFLQCPETAHAKGFYVKERVVISLKKAPLENSPVIGSASSDDYLEVRDQSGNWVKVVTPKGAEGWVSLIYLTEESPRSLIIEQLNAKLASFGENYKMLQETNKAMEKEIRELKYKLSNSNVEIQKTKNSFQRLKEASSDFLALEESYKKLHDADIIKSKQLDELLKENNRLKLSERIKFILIGGGFIILGLVTGYVLNTLRSKPKQTGYRL